MTTPDPSREPEPTKPAGTATTPYKDRVYRSPAGVVGGVLVLAIVAWLGIDAVVVGEGRTPWLALATMLFLVPVVFAYTLRPAVFVNDDGLRIRNPLRLIVLPWGQVASLRSGFSNEVVDDSGTKYQLWALPVSVRARSKAARQDARAARAAARADARAGQGGSLRGGAVGAADLGAGAALAADGPRRAETDRAMDELRELHERRQGEPGTQGEVTVRWAYEIIAPAVAGAVLLGVLWGLG
ncbi:PH domain-containing protein [Streptomyces griseoincarnatus]|uniref:PH domain-containing protein n=1 Tax=unclassified Streptomyces TaxID=2593676 RepID=UPI000C8828D7|nr:MULTISPECIES: PH domain-containing protein [unclassified Streptomyces]MBJ6644155.1 PH domain-containing protein [Streptomyces sp. BSE7-9]MCA2200235.1 PH domain-containing protein [Streptomyces sp. SMS_SU21]PWE09117.1 PH domain-containing protein [Streptomyces sp. BSE7F]